jgi:hypothetical protein
MKEAAYFLVPHLKNTKQKVAADVSRGVRLHEYSPLVIYHANGLYMKRA